MIFMGVVSNKHPTGGPVFDAGVVTKARQALPWW